jgi:DNA-binding LacI/PurR family transcriptional regulator
MKETKKCSEPSPKKRRVTQADIARQFGVTPGVVSVSLHGSPNGKIRVSPALVKKIKALAKKEGYIPNQAARQLSLQCSKMWGVFCDATPTERNALCLAQLHQAARDKGYRIVIEYFDWKKPDMKPILEVFHNLGVDGIICLHHYFPDQHTLVPRLLTKHFEHVVFIEKPQKANAHFCGVDYVATGRTAFQTLQQCGPRPGMLLPDTLWYAGPLLSKGFTEECEKTRPTPDYTPVWVANESGQKHEKNVFNMTTALQALDSWVLPNRLTGLAARNDEQAAIIINALHERGLHVPKDVAVIGLGNSRLCEINRPTLSSFDLQLEEAINTTAEKLYQLCQGEKPTATDCWIDPVLHLRQSCQPPKS